MADGHRKTPKHSVEITTLSSPPAGKDENGTATKDPEQLSEEDNVLDWNGPDDPEMPMNWPKGRKVGIIIMVTASRFLASLASSMMSPAIMQIESEFQDTAQTVITFTVSIYVIGTAIGPLVLAPMSELYGRSSIYHVGNVLYTAFTIGCALAPSASVLLVFRLLAGLAGGIPMTNAGGTIADIIPRERRGLITSISNATMLLSPTLAPIAGGFLAKGMGWRWIFWLTAILSVITTIAGTILLRETFVPVLLHRKAAKLRKQTGNNLLQARGGTTDMSFGQKILRTIRRPMVLLFTSPVLILCSLYLAFVFGVTYLLVTAMPIVFHDVYDWNEEMLGLAPIGMGIGALIGLFITGRYSDRIYIYRKQRLGGDGVPESRLAFLFPAAFLLPTGLIIFGWTAQFKTHWIAPMLGTGIFGVGMLFVFNGINSYLIDAFSLYAASAMAGASLLRGLAGGLLPLSGSGLYERLGYGWGNTLLGGLAVFFGCGSLVLWWFGGWLRGRYRVDLD